MPAQEWRVKVCGVERLPYNEIQHVVRKTAADVDEVEVPFVKLVENERIEQAVIFNSEGAAENSGVGPPQFPVGATF